MLLVLTVTPLLINEIQNLLLHCHDHSNAYLINYLCVLFIAHLLFLGNNNID